MRDPFVVRGLIASMSSETIKDGRVPVRLNGGPFDGCLIQLKTQVYLTLIRACASMFVPVSENGDQIATYTINPGPVAGCSAKFIGYGVVKGPSCDDDSA